jgi:hypothetical protein
VQITESAAENGHSAILKLAISQGVALSRETVLAAILGRSVECLKVAVESNPGNVAACVPVFAAVHGFFEGVRYLHSQGFPLWGEGTPIDAEGLLWLREALNFHVYHEYPPEWDESPEDPWCLRSPWLNLRWGHAGELGVQTHAGDVGGQTHAGHAEEQTHVGGACGTGGAVPMPQIGGPGGDVPYAGRRDATLADVVRVLGNSGVGGEALMEVGLVPYRPGSPPHLCSWETVSAAARAAATQAWDCRTCEDSVRGSCRTYVSPFPAQMEEQGNT